MAKTASIAPDRPPLRPLLKWAGGKRSEIAFLRASYPKGVQRVVEPFAGGAAVAFDWNAPWTILNDVSEGLVAFYRAMQDPSAKANLLQNIMCLHTARKRLSKSVCDLSDEALAVVFGDPSPWIASHAPAWLAGFPVAVKKVLLADLLASTASKTLKRIPALSKKHDKVFSPDELRAHLETGLQAGLYTSMRRIYNRQVAEVSSSWEVAAWWFVRSLCYSGMFRYGKNGNFNVPYGGIGYNSRDFTGSIEQLASPEVASFFSRASIHSLDFEALFKLHDGFGPSDFLFIDPPYDSAFSKYNHETGFAQADQKRLAKLLMDTKAPWMLVIKNTPFISGLYQAKGLHRGVFGKVYQANFRNRHARGVEHLVVANYPLVLASPGEIGIMPEVSA